MSKFYHPETGEILNGIARSLLSNDGRLEFPDPVPMAPVVNLRPASGMRQLVQEMIRQEMSQLAESMEMESFEEADDFDIEDDPLDPLTPYEKVFDPKDLPAGGPGTQHGSRPTEGGGPSSPPSSSSTTSGGNGNHAPPVTAGEISPREGSHEPATGKSASGGSASRSDGVSAARRPT